MAVLPRIPEILSLICEKLVDDGRALVKLAMTCKDFQEPALNVLWFELENFYPLVKCLPRDTWVQEMRPLEEDEGQRLRLRLVHPIDLNDCARLSHYASRVRRLLLDFESYQDWVDSTVFQGLQIALDGFTLFPNLQVLRWSCSGDSGNFPVIPMLLGPQLVSVDITLIRGCVWQSSLLPVLRRRCPSLEKLALRFPSRFRELQRVEENVLFISKAICNWHTLQKLQVPDLTHSALLEVAQFPSLRSLKLDMCRLDNDAPSTKIDNGFPSLRELDIHSQTASSCLAVIKVMDSSPVVEVQLKFCAIENAESWNAVFKSMADHFDRSMLQKLCCSDSERGQRRFNIQVALPHGPKREIIHFQDIKPLLAFKNMKHIELFITRGYYFIDPTITNLLAASWKNIEVLNLLVSDGPRGTQEASPTITLKDLLPFAEHCPHLVDLGLPLDASIPPEIPVHRTEDRSPRQSSLTSLFVVGGPIENIHLVATKLSGIFPSLKNIDYLSLPSRDGEEGNDVQENWRQVERLVRLFSAVRAEERFYITSQ